MRCTAAASVVVVPSLRSDARGWWGRALSVLGLTAVAHRMALWCHRLPMAPAIFYSQLSAMDVSARTTMKGAAKCDKHCGLQNSVNRQELERILCFWDIPESMPASVSMLCCSSSVAIVARCCECSCLKMRSVYLRVGHGAPEAFDSQGPAATASLLSISVCG